LPAERSLTQASEDTPPLAAGDAGPSAATVDGGVADAEPPADDAAARSGTEVLEEPEPSIEPAEAETMVVTGSRIKRSAELASSAPVDILDHKALERTGAAYAGDLLQALTSAQGSGFQGGGNPNNQGGGARGTVTVNLRGLGAGSTLVLLNGRRLTPTAGGSDETLGDLGMIPLSAIERIEILKGGGSAIYGADAVGGVVNIITRNTWDGVRVELNGQNTTRFDQGDVTASAGFGAKSERARISAAVSYLRRGELLSTKRPFAAAANVEQNGNPGTFIAPGLDPSNPMRLRFVDPACGSVPGSAVVHTTINGMQTPDETCSFSTAPYTVLVGAQERANGFVSASYDLSSHTTIFMELLASRMRQDGAFPPSFPIPPPLLSVPADHIDNPFGRTVAFLGRPLGAAAGARRGAASDDTLRAVAGLRGDFADVARDSVFEAWEWELAASWGISRYTLMAEDTLRAPLQAALNSCSDPSNLSGCFNPFFSAVDGTGTPNSQQVIDKITSMQTTMADYALHTYNAGLTGPLLELPGGTLSLAVGGEYRYEWRASRLDHHSNLQEYAFLLGNSNGRAARNVASGYVELRWPLYRGIELQTAARLEHYSDIEQTTPSPFAGLTLAPGKIGFGNEAPALLRKLQVTGQVTSAFRAPTMYQSFPGFSVRPSLLNVPGSPTAVFLPVQQFGNPALEPERALVVSSGINWQPVEPLTVNLELWNYSYAKRIALESATQALANDNALLSMGMTGDPRVIHDPMTGSIQQVQVTQRNIPGRIVTNGIDATIMMSLSGESFGGSRSDWGVVTFGTQGTLTLNYSFPKELAAPRTIANVSPMRSLPPLNCGATSCEAVGSRNYNNLAPPLPRFRFNFPVYWSYGPHSVSMIAHWLSGLENDNDVDANGNLGHLAARVTVDLQYGVTIPNWLGKELSFRVGAYNLFDTFPPVTRDQNGHETLLYDPRGRVAYANLKAVF
ncbi:MAG TPA: TonB-dependent receptor plug domain-containing protein, partial [Polyangiales bacterium]|nr:TonB-dependent receptor plug domain-containing protein [Polyangiales bacterium]